MKKYIAGGAGLWVLLVLVLIGGWVGYKIGMLYFDNSTLENLIAEMGDSALLGREDTLRTDIVREMAYRDIQFDPEKVGIEFSEKHDQVKIEIPYQCRANLLLFRPQLSFEISVVRNAKKPVGIVRQVQESVEGSGAATARKYEQAVRKATGTTP